MSGTAPAQADGGGSASYDVCVTAIAKNEAPYIEEWLAYHLGIGVEHFFIFDNGSTDGMAKVLSPWINHGLVTLLHWPMTGGQIDAYNYALAHFGPRTRWMAYIDVDEFIVPKAHETIGQFIDSLGDVDQILMPWRNFSYSGHRTRPEGLVIESYTQAQDLPPQGLGQMECKAMIRTAATRYIVEAHHGATFTNNSVNEKGEWVKEGCSVPNPSFDLVQLNHYYTKSFEEMEAKIRRGQVSGGNHKSVPAFDRPGYSTTDTTILARLDQTKAVLESVRSLPPDPFRFGTLRRRAAFRVRNPMGWLQQLTLSNHIARTPRISLGIPVPFDNLAAGTSHVLHADEHGWAAAPGAMAACIHVRDLFRRLRAEPVWMLETSSLSRLRCVGATLAPTAEGALELVARGEGAAGLVFLADSDAPRCYALVFAVTVPGATGLKVTAHDASAEWSKVGERAVRLPGAGTYLGIVELPTEPAKVARIGLELAEGGAVFQDLMLVSYV